MHEARKRLQFFFTKPSTEELDGVVTHWDMDERDADDWIRLLELAGFLVP